MIIFLMILAYMIVKFKTFNVKLAGAQALVVSLVVLIGSEFFFIQNNTNRIITAFTLVFTGAIGLNLVRSVKKEIAQREEIERQKRELELANSRLKELDQLKSEFVSLATHQIRGPLTSIKGYASMMLDGDYGEVPQTLKGPIDTIFQSSQSLAVIVEDFLSVSRIEQGKMKYDFTNFDLCALVNEVISENKPSVEKKGLVVSATVCPDSLSTIGDLLRRSTDVRD
jgi:signal transduction histidine kinase